MAEDAANFTFTSQNRPSIFEIVAQKSLNDTLHPGLQKVALFLYQSNPNRFKWLENNYEETFLVLNGLLQFYYLKFCDSSFSENFYGLKRIQVNNDSITLDQKLLSLLIVVVLPYLKRKCEEKLAIYRLEIAESSLRNNFEGHAKRVLIFAHSTFELTWSAVSLITYLKYMSNQSAVQLPVLELIKLKLCYSNQVLDSPSFWKALFTGQLKLSSLNFGLVRNAVSSTLEVLAFFLQFLHTWNAEKTNLKLTDLPIVQSPPLDNKAKSYKGKCPICLKNWQNPTLLQVSGYIFCFRCVTRFLNTHQKCPVTNLPAKPLNIVRLYIND